MQVSMSVVAPAIALYFFHELSTGKIYGSFLITEVIIVTSMQVVYCISVVNLYFMIDALVRIYYSLADKSLFYRNTSGMLLHLFAYTIFIATLLSNDFMDINEGRKTGTILTPMPVVVLLLISISSFFSQVFLIQILKSHCESFKLVMIEEA